MRLIDLQLTKKESRKERAEAVSVPSSGVSIPKYPWGLEVRLDESSISKLGLDISKLSAGNMVTVTAQAKIIRLEAPERVDERTGSVIKERSLTLQLQKMSLEKSGAGLSRKHAIDAVNADNTGK